MRDEWRQMVDDCMDRESKLSEWEFSFIDSLNILLDNDYSLSMKQIDVLERIWENVTKNG